METWNFNSLSIGDSIPPLIMEPISRSMLALYAGASGDHNPIHIDLDFAKGSGLPDVIAHGMLIMSYVAQTLTNSFPQAMINNLEVQFCSITQIKDKLTCSGKVLNLIHNKKEDSIILALNVINEDGDEMLKGTALINMESP
jgi:acyl dehydratase